MSPLWPANIPTFEKIQRKFSSACLDLALRVFDVISVGLDLEVKLIFELVYNDNEINCI